MGDHSSYTLLSWDHGSAEIKSFSATSRAKDTLLKIEILVHDSFTLSSLMRDLSEAQENQRKRKAAPKPASGKKMEERLALPAPTPRLTYGGHDDT